MTHKIYKKVVLVIFDGFGIDRPLQVAGWNGLISPRFPIGVSAQSNALRWTQSGRAPIRLEEYS